MGVEEAEVGTGRGGAVATGVGGVVAAVAGLVVGLLPVAATGGGTCGSPFAPASHGSGMSNALIGSWCADDLGTRRIWAWLLIIGGLVLVGIAVSLWRSRGPEPVVGSSVSGELARLAELRETGALSEEEFAVAKSRVLERDVPEK